MHKSRYYKARFELVPFYSGQTCFVLLFYSLCFLLFFHVLFNEFSNIFVNLSICLSNGGDSNVN